MGGIRTWPIFYAVKYILSAYNENETQRNAFLAQHTTRDKQVILIHILLISFHIELCLKGIYTFVVSSASLHHTWSVVNYVE